MRSPWWHPSAEELQTAEQEVKAAREALETLETYIHERWLRHGGAIDSKQISLNQNRGPRARERLRVAEANLGYLRERDDRYRTRRKRRVQPAR